VDTHCGDVVRFTQGVFSPKGSCALTETQQRACPVQAEGDIAMKRVLVIAITMLMVLGMFQMIALPGAPSVEAEEADVPAIYIANRWAPVGARWNGNTLVDERTRNFDGVGTSWGTNQNKMPGPGAVVMIDPMGSLNPVYINENPALVPEPPRGTPDQRYSQPRYWTEFYILAIPDKGQSQEYNRWYAVVDDMGQLWFDPDGRFNDSRYYAAADPETEAYKYLGGEDADNCKNNPHCKVDPSNANNTQGPYPFMPTDENGNFTHGIATDSYPMFDTSNGGGLFFMPDTSRTGADKRVFQVGYVDMPDYPLVRDGASSIPVAGIDRPNIPAIGTNLVDTVVGTTEVIEDTTVLPYETRDIDDWDADLPLVRFIDGFTGNPPPPTYTIPGETYLSPPRIWDTTNTGTWWEYFVVDNQFFEYGEEWHSDNVVTDPPDNMQFTSPQMDIYDPGEWIYRAGAAGMIFGTPTQTEVFGYNWTSGAETYDYAYWGCTRLTPVAMELNGVYYSYAPGSIVRDAATRGQYDPLDDADLNHPVTLANTHPLWRFPVDAQNFSNDPQNPAPMVVRLYSQFHTDSVNYNPNSRCSAGDDIYDPYEGIYMKGGGDDIVVEVGDFRLTNVNGNEYGLESWLHGVSQAVMNPHILSIGGMWFGDVLVLSEIVTGGCAAPSYNLSVQTDIWEGMIPSETCAALRSPNDDFDRVAQNVQKNAVLDPTGLKFQYPTTIFQDMKFGYREFVGVEVWHDNNKDCNLGLQYPGPVPPGENLYMLNLSDDYRQGHTGEAHLGMQDGYGAKDVGRMLSVFWAQDYDPSPLDGWGPATPNEVGPRFFDTLNPGGFMASNMYGVGEAIYWDGNADYEISAGDIRMSDVTVQRGNGTFAEIVFYKKGSVVTAGDADVDQRLGAPDLSDFVPVMNPMGQVIYWPAYFDERVEDINNPGKYILPDGNFTIGEVIYDCAYTGMTMVSPGFQRLMDVTLGNVTYKAGSVVQEQDLWLYQMPMYGISMGNNCSYQYADMIAAPGTTGMKVEINHPLKVEQTSQIDITFDPAPQKEYYDEFGVYHPEEVIYVAIENIGSPGYNDINEIYRVVSGRQPVARFQFTPYRGSCTNSGSADRVNYLDEDSNYNVRIRSYRDLGGTNKPAPVDRKYYDQWWTARHQDDPTMLEGKPYRLQQKGIEIAPVSPMPPLPYDLENGYDCYTELTYLVSPEDIDVLPSVACLQTLDQRFPNFSVTLFDNDNPVDVNDPNGMRIAVPLTEDTLPNPTYAREQYLIATYNGNGGGVAWIGTAVDGNPGQTKRQYILQANEDGTYLYWYWLEPTNPAGNDRSRPQIYGAIDANDLLLGADFVGTVNWRPGGGPYVPADQRTCRTPIIIKDKEYWKDTDCSARYIDCEPGVVEGMKPMGEVTGMNLMWNAHRNFTSPIPAMRAADYYGHFDGVGPLNSVTSAAAWIAGINPPWPGNATYPTPLMWTGPWATGYGVQTVVTSYGQTDSEDPGGDALIAILPRDGKTHLQLEMYTVNAIYDYNSTITHPEDGTTPYFVLDPLDNQGIDYLGVADIKVYQPDPYVNFAEWNIVDHALQYSNVDYTAGANALNNLRVPTPQIQTPYNPILRTSKGEFRCYPGGQTHTGRVVGGTFGEGGAFGWNAYPAIWDTRFYKLGTEFFPLTDYGIFFILKDGEGNHLSFDPCWPVDQRIKRIEIVGPFARPREWDATTHTVLPKYKAWGLENVPIQYDWSGKIVIDSTNWTQFELPGVDSAGNGISNDFTRRALLGDVSLPPANDLLNYNGRLDYTMVGACSSPGDRDNLFVIDEIIPWNYGKILLYVTLWDGTFKMYQDCCVSPPVDGIDVMALDMSLEIEEDPERDKAFIQAEGMMPTQTFNVTLKEYHPLEKETEWFDGEGNAIEECNDAVMFVWQDRGTKARGTANLLFGAGDGWITKAPTSSRRTYRPEQYEEADDINEDMKIRFNDWETEILGTYDMVTNTWTGGLIEGRTFQRNDGLYKFVLSDKSAIVDTVGLDFGGEVVVDQQDHLIARNEVLPLYITAYKYGDDDNDRGFSPFWDFDPQSQSNTAGRRYSHEVYLAAQMAVPVEPECDLVVTTTPDVLTAGVTPELVDVTKPLTFNIMYGSDPVNLLEGIADEWGNVEIKEEDAWNHLFLDPHPDNTYFFGHEASLPQYYWIRTDLHNDDGSTVNNAQLYGLRNAPDEPVIVPFNPIEIDFSNAENGTYVFKGFCANDNNQYQKDFPNYDDKTMAPGVEDKEAWWKEKHAFKVVIYTPDRYHAGCVELDVKSPQVEYKITNVEDPNRVAYDSPGDPDFVMTAADNRIYKIRVTIKDAMGVLLKGITKGVSVCGGGVKNTARFTPFSTRPQSFDFTFEDCMQPPCCTPVELHIGFDFVPDESIRRDDRELYILSGFSMNKSSNASSCTGSSSTVSMGSIRYNTSNKWYWGDNKWDVTIEDGDEVMPWIAWDLPPPVEGWGVGSIYNHCWYGGFLFADIDRDGDLKYFDALGLDVNAQTEFYLWAEDVAYIGGLVGDNKYGNTPAHSDLAGFPPFNDKTDPRYTEKRFRQAYTNDEVFYLDWEAPPDKVALIDSPRIEILRASDREPLSREALNQNNYDLTYGIENHIIAVVRPADDRDVGMKEDSRVYMMGNQHETTVFGHTKRSPEDAKAVETTLEFLPTGTNEAIAEITFMSPNKWYLKDPYQFVVPEWYSVRNHGMKHRDRPADEWNPWLFDSALGLAIELYKEGEIYPQTEGKLIAIVKQAGTNQPVAGATVAFTGAGIDVEVRTDNKGEAVAKVTPSEMGFIKATASMEGYLNSPSAEIAVSKDATPPTLSVDAVKTPTNGKKQTISGKAEPGTTVTVNGKKATVDKDGNWSIEVELEEGTNVVSIICTDPAGNKTQSTVTIVVDTTPPDIIVDAFEQVVDGTEYEIVGRVEPGSKVWVNGKEAEVVNDYFRVTVPLNEAPSFTEVRIEAEDAAGNKTALEPMRIENVHKLMIWVQQDNLTMIRDGVEMQLTAAPANIKGSMMLPFRGIAEQGFGAEVEWIAETKTVIMILGQIRVELVIGSTTALVNGKEVTMTAPAQVVGGSTFVPLRFVGEAFGAEVLYNAQDRSVDITLIQAP